MSYQVLARKWRPGAFSEMAGQQHVLQALKNALQTGRLHHAYLFTGTRGVGKTTVARIVAKCLNCETGVTQSPCGVCGNCLAIAEGRSIDLIEVDAASKTKVEDTRDLLDNVQYLPTAARYKIYLIDEVHMLSTHSFNALLKTLEEPPAHVIFLFATTDPQKLPPTVLSRCLQFNLKNMQPEVICEHLAHILKGESVEYEDEALALLAYAADGSMRDALSLTDQAISYGDGRLVTDQVREMLGAVDRDRVFDLLVTILDDDPTRMLSKVAEISEYAPDFVSILNELSAILHQITIAQMVPDSLERGSLDQARILDLANRATIDEIHLFWQMAQNGLRELHLASTARSALEMILLRMIAFRPVQLVMPDTDSEGSAANSEGLAIKKSEPPGPPVETSTASDQQGRGIPSLMPPKVVATQSSMDYSSPSNDLLDMEGTSTAVSEKSYSNFASVSVDKFAQESIGATLSRSSAPLNAEMILEDNHCKNDQPIKRNDQSKPCVDDNNDHDKSLSRLSSERRSLVDFSEISRDQWPSVFEKLSFEGLLRNIALNLEIRKVTASSISFAISEATATLLSERHPKQLSIILSEAIGQKVSVEIEVVSKCVDTPALSRSSKARELMADTEHAILNDEQLIMIMKMFDGEIIPGSIRPNGEQEHRR